MLINDVGSDSLDKLYDLGGANNKIAPPSEAIIQVICLTLTGVQ